MDTLEAIHTRRSIRKYQDRDVSEELITELLSAAMSAPSAGNAQTWQFVVVRDQGQRQAVAEINQYAAMAPKAPVGVLVCGDLGKEKYPGYWVQDCAAAVQTLLLAAHAKGLGAVWTGIYPTQDRVEKFSVQFNLPENVIPLAYVVLGYPDQDLKPQDRYDAANVHYDRW
ncbi:MAG: nitroreductase family protein [Desulfovibrio sp.]|uniref:nitroreductase family protein n=1 Tax=Desulfovibrio sp. 7SRBS1 TaxID=3378064 RepID=UPI003B3FA5D9